MTPLAYARVIGSPDRNRGPGRTASSWCAPTAAAGRRRPRRRRPAELLQTPDTTRTRPVLCAHGPSPHRGPPDAVDATIFAHVPRAKSAAQGRPSDPASCASARRADVGSARRVTNRPRDPQPSVGSHASNPTSWARAAARSSARFTWARRRVGGTANACPSRISTGHESRRASRASRARLMGSPPLYPPTPLLATTRWHGTMIAMGFLPLA
jgi:hypothetical protein